MNVVPYQRPKLVASSSGRQIAAAEIVNRQHDALEVVPPDRGADVVGRLPHRSCDQPKHRQMTILVQGLTVVAAHAIVQQRRVVEVEQWPLHPALTVRVPEHRHHVGQIVSRDIDAPAFPIDQPDVLASAISGQEEIPWVRIAVDIVIFRLE